MLKHQRLKGSMYGPWASIQVWMLHLVAIDLIGIFIHLKNGKLPLLFASISLDVWHAQLVSKHQEYTLVSREVLRVPLLSPSLGRCVSVYLDKIWVHGRVISRPVLPIPVVRCCVSYTSTIGKIELVIGES